MLDQLAVRTISGDEKAPLALFEPGDRTGIFEAGTCEVRQHCLGSGMSHRMMML